MVTLSRSGIIKAISRLSLNTSPISPFPKSPFLALTDTYWSNAMYDEYNALVKNGTWVLVPRLADVNMVRSMWLFKHKFHVHGTLSRYKSRLVAIDSSQQLGVDFDETFSPVVKPATIHTVFILPVSPSSTALHQQIIYSLHKEYDMTDLGKKYALQHFERAHMVSCIPSWTPVDTEAKLGPDGVLVQDLTLYRSLVGGLQYLTFTRPDLSYAVHSEAEYRGVANVVAETTWIRNLLRELHSPLVTDTLVYCDNVSFVYMSANPVQHQQTKHIEIGTHFVRDMITAGDVHVLHVPSRFQYAYIFTKGIPSALFEEFRSSLSVHSFPAQTVVLHYL
uniref:Ribonuclease H-like domain-containing protein n=1 Tax=Tanacetum cinerariifolium TaxID=118510 RepID=A0A6L2KYK5_TANCI|nr:ribonuclease H-like domain-containing protein [Tanacetum cinerariifolium]